MAMYWVKTFHVFFVVGWFAGLFYLPRIFVNLALVGEEGAVRERLLLMARKLYRFTKLLSVFALVLGGVLWLYFGIGRGEGNGWMHAKLTLVALLVAYQFACGRELAQWQAGTSRRSHRWYRWFNELPTVLLLGVLAMVIVRPF